MEVARSNDTSNGNNLLLRDYVELSSSISSSEAYVLRLSGASSTTPNERRSRYSLRTSDHSSKENLSKSERVNSDADRHSMVTIKSNRTTIWTGHGSSSSIRTVGLNQESSTTDSAGRLKKQSFCSFNSNRLTIGDPIAVASDEGTPTENVPPQKKNSMSSTRKRRSSKIGEISKIIDEADMELDDTSSSGQVKSCGISKIGESDMDLDESAGPLNGVFAYIEVFCGAENRSIYFADIIRKLGGQVCERFIKKVTHVVYSEGRESTLSLAKTRKVPLVSVLWIDAAERLHVRPNDEEYPAYIETPTTDKKRRRLRSMAPIPNEAKIALSDERVKQRQKRQAAYRLRKEMAKLREEFDAPGSSDNYERNPNPKELAAATPQQETSSGMSWAQLAELRREIHEAIGYTPCSDDSEENGSLSQSVRRRLYDVGCPLHGTPLPDLLTRPKLSDFSSYGKSNSKAGGTSSAKGSCADGAATGTDTAKSQTTTDVTAGKEKQNADNSTVSNASARPAVAKSKRRIFDPTTVQRLSDVSTPDTSEKAGDCAASLTDKLMGKGASVCVEEVFGQLQLQESAVQKKGKKKKNVLQFERLESNASENQEIGRRSGDDFRTPQRQAQNKRKGKAPVVKSREKRSPPNRKAATRSIVTTNLSKRDRELVYVVVKEFGGFRYAKKACDDTTHVITGGSQRTLNILSGVARGCSMLPLEWVLRSIENGSWLDEDNFELVDDFPGAQTARVAAEPRNQSFNVEGRGRIFESLGSFYICPSSSPPAADLAMLIKWSGGKVCSSNKRATFCIGGTSKYAEVVAVKETWILDSIMEQHVLDVENYVID